MRGRIFVPPAARFGISRIELYGESGNFGLAYNSAPQPGLGAAKGTV
jgi:hypothetical protein